MFNSNNTLGNQNNQSTNQEGVVKPRLIKKNSNNNANVNSTNPTNVQTISGVNPTSSFTSSRSNLGTMDVAKTPNTTNTIPSANSIGHNFTIDGQLNNNVEEKVAQLSLQMNQVIVRPYLQQALDYLRTSKHDSINAYNQLSDQIANEIRIISQNTQQISASLKEAQDVVARTQEIIRNKYNNALEEEISSGALNLDYEYNIVAEHYELSLQLTQELSRYKARIDSLLSTQGMLDESIVPSISRLQLEIDNLELLLHSFDSSDYADILAKKTGTSVSKKTAPNNDFKTCSDELNKMVAASSINSLDNFEQQNLHLNEMNRNVGPNENMIRTNQVNPNNNPTNNYQNQQFVENNYYNDQNNQRFNRKNKNTINNNQNYNNQYVNNSQFVYEEPMNQQAQQMNYGNYNGPAPMSRKEAKMIEKLREQQLKFETMMRMNEMIFAYNKSIDEMILKQKEYEAAHREQLAEAERRYGNIASDQTTVYPSTNSRNNLKSDDVFAKKQVYESNAPIETVADNLKRSNVDKVFVVRQAEPITEDQAKELKKRGSVRSIKVVK